VLANQLVGRNEGRTIGPCLRDNQPVEGVAGPGLAERAGHHLMERRAADTETEQILQLRNHDLGRFRDTSNLEQVLKLENDRRRNL
jgi:hypothetical protein